MAISGDVFKTALSRFASGVTVVTGVDSDGAPFGITVSSFCSVSLNPPLILVCIGKGGRAEAALSQGSRFGVNILTEHQKEISNTFASQSGSPFDGIDTVLSVDGIPIINNSAASLVCSNYNSHEEGDHVIFVGLVEQCEISEEDPLLYFKSRYRKLAEIS